jgi:succinyl-diaminopimelate desuccinylase
VETKTIFNEIEKLRNEMTQTLLDLIRIPAIGPESGGEGELQKAEKLAQICKAIGFDKIQSCDAPDERVPSKKRSNIIAFMNGETDKERIWIVTHMDIVPPGEDSLWTVAKPFSPIVKDGKVYGRGSEDNTQATVSSIFALKAFKNLRLKPKRTVGLCFVADEESGSEYGIQYLIKQGLFKKDDLVIVPDGGNSDGSFIEIAEKSSIWLKINTIGKQAHASMPDTGLNAHRVGMEFAVALDKMLHKKYARKDVLFDPPMSTFEPTKKDRNVDAINIVPGEDTTYLDGRILPCYDVDELLGKISALASEFDKKTGAKIRIEVVNKNIATEPTSERAKIVLMLKKAITKTGRKNVKVGGIGGGTCAAFFREAGIPAVVWATMDEMAHQPNEYAKVDNMVNDAKVFAYLAEQS